MYVTAPPGTVELARLLIPEQEYERLSSLGFNSYGEAKSMAILQFLRDLDWIYISYEESEVLSLKPTQLGLDVFEMGLEVDQKEGIGELIDHIKKYLEAFLTDGPNVADVMQELGDYYLKAGNYTRAIDLGSDLITLGNEHHDPRVLGKAHDIYGAINLYRQDIDFAQNHFEKSVLYGGQCNDLETVAKGHMGLGSVNGYRQKFKESIENFEKAFLLFKEVGDEAGINQVKLNEAFTYANMGELGVFFKMNHEAISYFESVNDRHKLQYCYVNESTVLLSMGKIDEAIESIVEAHELAKEVGNKRILHMSGLNIARIYVLTKRPGEAYEYITQAHEYFRKNFDTNSVGACNDLLASYFLAMKDIPMAREHLEKMERNFQVKRNMRGIVDGFSYFIRTMKTYSYTEKEVAQMIDELRKKLSGNEFKEIFEESLNEEGIF